MIVNDQIFSFLLIAISLSIGGCFYLFSTLNQRLKVTVAILLGGMFWGGIQLFCGKLYIIESDNNKDYTVKVYKLFGSKSYEMANGKSVKINGNYNKVSVINNSSATLILEPIQYLSDYSRGFEYTLNDKKIISINSYSFNQIFIPKGYIDYPMLESIPKEIELRGFNKDETRYWLHKK